MLSILRCINPIPFRGNIVRFYITKMKFQGAFSLWTKGFGYITPLHFQAYLCLWHTTASRVVKHRY